MFTLYPELFLRIGSSIEIVAGHGKDVFVHISAVQRAGMDDLREGAKVTFDIVDNRGKPVADNLRVK
jgi:cold shock CspA family protein